MVSRLPFARKATSVRIVLRFDRFGFSKRKRTIGSGQLMMVTAVSG
ncbi:MAG: hypothetical protein JKY65_05915 [Planctomycetes bacterium]|nr:hypothetical protein [Planctomycetota bacterium]